MGTKYLVRDGPVVSITPVLTSEEGSETAITGVSAALNSPVLLLGKM